VGTCSRPTCTCTGCPLYGLARVKRANLPAVGCGSLSIDSYATAGTTPLREQAGGVEYGHHEEDEWP
jgi:hypothetical protein